MTDSLSSPTRDGRSRPSTSSRPSSSDHQTRLPAVRPSHSAGQQQVVSALTSPDRSASVGDRRILSLTEDGLEGDHDHADADADGDMDDGTGALSASLQSTNPFSLPREDVFSLRDRERASKQEERARLNSMKIWEKPARPGQVMDTDKDTTARSSYQERKTGRQQYMAATSKERIFQGRRREKENMADFIAKKRDMFLIQMSLDTKRQEIHKLEEKAQMKEDALKKSEMMLEEDAMRFDAFLKENDRKAHDALKRADQETKEKQEKVMEIKKLNQEISKVENEMSKYEEQLHACLKYKEFLDSLTPPEYLEELRKKKEERRRLKRESSGSKLDTSRSTSKSSARSSSTQQQRLEDHHTDDEDDGDEELEPMYFQRPEQLLEIFAQLEERNLFLIQNVQETEEALEELKTKFEDTEQQMEQKTDQLHSNIADLKGKISAENEKAEALKKRTRASTIAGNQQKLLHGLSDKVREVYERCGFDPDTQTDTLDMLREIEGWLEYLLNEIKTMDPDKVELAEKKKNTERRNRVRKIKKEEQKRIYEERLAKSTARAKAEVIRRTGKQVMFRSPPIHKKKVQEATVERDEEAEELKQFFT